MSRKRVHEEIIRESSSSSSSSAAQTHTKSLFNTDFCMEITKQLLLIEAVKKGSNFVFSPLSIHTILSLIAAGSTGHTLEQLLSFLRSNSVIDLNSLYSQQIVSLVSSSASANNKGNTHNINGDDGGPLLSFGNSLWIDKSFFLKPSYADTVKVTYGAELKQVDFKTKAEQVTIEVNSWAENATNGLIKDILPSGSLDSSTALVLTNALYFKGAWNRKFDVSGTQDRDFHLLNGDDVRVSFMTSERREKHMYRSLDEFKVLKLPYQSGGQDTRHFSMYFFLAHERNGLQNLIEKFSSNSGFLDQHFELREEELAEFWIPRFKISFGFRASETMKELGVVMPFTDAGELTEMIECPQNERLYVSDIFHKSFIEVNEEGTEAAASTAARIRLCSGRRSPPTFVADHPFMFTIKEEVTGVVFFVGVVVNPLLVS